MDSRSLTTVDESVNSETVVENLKVTERLGVVVNEEGAYDEDEADETDDDDESNEGVLHELEDLIEKSKSGLHEFVTSSTTTSACLSSTPSRSNMTKKQVVYTTEEPWHSLTVSLTKIVRTAVKRMSQCS